jgi:hypothetical protein
LAWTSSTEEFWHLANAGLRKTEIRKKHKPPAGVEGSPAFTLPVRYTGLVMPFSRLHFARGQFQFITSSGYRRTELFDGSRLRRDFVELSPATSGGSRDLLAAK